MFPDILKPEHCIAHAPLGGIPGCEPPSKGGGLEPLLDQDDGGARVSGPRVGAQILLASNQGFLAFYLVGFLTDPDKNLEATRRSRILKEKLFFLCVLYNTF